MLSYLLPRSPMTGPALTAPGQSLVNAATSTIASGYDSFCLTIILSHDYNEYRYISFPINLVGRAEKMCLLSQFCKQHLYIFVLKTLFVGVICGATTALTACVAHVPFLNAGMSQCQSNCAM